jgi:hypothetical protein
MCTRGAGTSLYDADIVAGRKGRRRLLRAAVESLELESLSDEIQYSRSGQGQEMRTGIASASGGEERVMNRARGHEILATESE